MLKAVRTPAGANPVIVENVLYARSDGAGGCVSVGTTSATWPLVVTEASAILSTSYGVTAVVVSNVSTNYNLRINGCAVYSYVHDSTLDPQGESTTWPLFSTSGSLLDAEPCAPPAPPPAAPPTAQLQCLPYQTTFNTSIAHRAFQAYGVSNAFPGDAGQPGGTLHINNLYDGLTNTVGCTDVNTDSLKQFFWMQLGESTWYAAAADAGKYYFGPDEQTHVWVYVTDNDDASIRQLTPFAVYSGSTLDDRTTRCSNFATPAETTSNQHVALCPVSATSPFISVVSERNTGQYHCIAEVSVCRVSPVYDPPLMPSPKAPPGIPPPTSPPAAPSPPNLPPALPPHASPPAAPPTAQLQCLPYQTTFNTSIAHRAFQAYGVSNAFPGDAGQPGGTLHINNLYDGLTNTVGCTDVNTDSLKQFFWMQLGESTWYAAAADAGKYYFGPDEQTHVWVYVTDNDDASIRQLTPFAVYSGSTLDDRTTRCSNFATPAETTSNQHVALCPVSAASPFISVVSERNTGQYHCIAEVSVCRVTPNYDPPLLPPPMTPPALPSPSPPPPAPPLLSLVSSQGAPVKRLGLHTAAKTSTGPRMHPPPA